MDGLLSTQAFWFLFGAVLMLAAVLAKRWVDVTTVTQQLLLQNVLAERSRWRSDVRLGTIEFCTLAGRVKAAMLEADGSQAERIFAEHVDRLTELRLGLRLCINPDEPSREPGNQLLQALNRVMYLLSIDELDGVAEEVLRIERSAQKLLKAEWERAKAEANSGRLKIVSKYSNHVGEPR